LRFGEAITDWWEKKKDDYAPSSRKEYQNRISKLLIPEFGKCDVRDITYDMIEAFRLTLTKERTEKTVSNILAILKAFYGEQKRRGVSPPVFPEVRLGEEIDRGWCDWDTFIEVVNEIPHEMDREFAITSRLEWLRPGETRALMWGDFDWTNDILKVTKAFSLTTLKHTKTKRVAYKPIHPVVREILLPRKGHPDGYVFMRNNKPYSESWMRKQWNIAAQSKNLRLSLYEATRHSAASVAASDLHSIYVISETLGHTDIRTTQRYAHVNMKAKRSVLEKTGNTVMAFSLHKKNDS
jgi:integrase